MKKKIKMAIMWLFNREKYRIVKRIEMLEKDVEVAKKNHKKYSWKKFELDELRSYLEQL